jgi:hypothetical protein
MIRMRELWKGKTVGLQERAMAHAETRRRSCQDRKWFGVGCRGLTSSRSLDGNTRRRHHHLNATDRDPNESMSSCERNSEVRTMWV